MNEHEEEYRQVNVRFTEAEIAAVRDITKVDALAPAVRAVVLKAIEAVVEDKAVCRAGDRVISRRAVAEATKRTRKERRT